MDEIERQARQIAAWKMGLVKDRRGERLPDDLWRQYIPAAKAELMDIVERLRKRIDPDDPDLWVLDRDRIEAADEIERLRARLAVLERFVAGVDG